MHHRAPTFTILHLLAPTCTFLQQSAPTCTNFHHPASTFTNLQLPELSWSNIQHPTPSCIILQQSALSSTILLHSVPFYTMLPQSTPSCRIMGSILTPDIKYKSCWCSCFENALISCRKKPKMKLNHSEIRYFSLHIIHTVLKPASSCLSCGMSLWTDKGLFPFLDNQRNVSFLVCNERFLLSSQEMNVRNKLQLDTGWKGSPYI